MDPVSIGAMRQYQIAKQAVTPDASAKPQAMATLETKEPSLISRGVAEFSQVFEAVDSTTQAFSAGTGDAHSVVQALATAEVALEGAVTIRNRVVEAYQELLRMPV